VWRATRTPEGPATLRLRAVVGSDTIRATAWGDGAAWALRQAPELIGCGDDDSGLAATRVRHPLVARLHRRLPGLRMPRTRMVADAMAASVIEQKVTGLEAHRSYRQLALRYGEAAPGPGGLWLPPDLGALAGAPYYDLHRFGVERRRADTVRRVARHAHRLDATVDAPLDQAHIRMTAIAGVGPWTAAEVAQVALGDADAVSVGDYHLPHQVAYALAGERRATNARMLELLEPFRGHRGRVARLIVAAGLGPPRRAPRARLRSIARI